MLLATLLLSACQPQNSTVTEAPESAPTEKTEQPVATAVKAETPAAEEELPYGLLPGKPYEGETITILLNNDAKNTAMQMRTKEFTELTGIEVVIDMVPFANLLEKVTAEGVGGTGAYDVVTYLDSWGSSVQSFLVPIDDRIAEAGIDMARYPAAYRQAVTYDGQVYALPWRGHPQLLFYRKDVMEQLGLKVPTTWAEYEEVAKAITEETDLYGTSMYYGKNAGQNMFVWSTFMWSNGADIFDKDWKPIFNSPEGVEATQRYIDLLRNGLTPPGAVTYNEYDGTQSVAQGESAMIITWWWQYTRMTDPTTAKPEVVDNIGFAPVPEWEGKGGATYAICMPLAIMKDSQHQEAAWEFLKWVTNPELEKEIVTTKETPETTTNIAVQISNLEDPDVNAAWNNMHQFASKSLAVSRIMPQLAEWPEVVSVLETAINEMASGADVQATLDKAAGEVEEIMKRAGYY
jgi:multiple sugar transport system substrate-binding protein